MIYTFYSYKGGVGRSMALANVADLFYKAGLNVLIIDWDLEAPGLERFFVEDISEVYDAPGIIDMLLDYKDQVSQDWGSHRGERDELPLTNPSEFRINIYPKNAEGGQLWLIPAGRRIPESAYAERILSFDWNDFYRNWGGGLYFDWLGQQLKSIADVILIDSRTGVTEMEAYAHTSSQILSSCSVQQIAKTSTELKEWHKSF